MNQQTKTRIQAGGMILAKLLSLAIIFALIGCKNSTDPTPTGEQKQEDLTFSYGKITVIIDKNVAGNFSQAYIEGWEEWLQWFFSLEEGNPTYNNKVYVNSKDKFTICIKPLNGKDYDIINDKEIIINSNSVDVIGDFVVFTLNAITNMTALYPLAQAKNIDGLNPTAKKAHIAWEKANKDARG